MWLQKTQLMLNDYVTEKMMAVSSFRLACERKDYVLQRQCYVCRKPFYFPLGTQKGHIPQLQYV